MTVTVELSGLEIFGRHGVEDSERRDGRVFLFDLWLDVPETAVADRIEKTVDYREVAACVREISESRAFHLLEALAASIADELVERFPLERVRVRVRKPGVEVAGTPMAYSAAVVERFRKRS